MKKPARLKRSRVKPRAKRWRPPQRSRPDGITWWAWNESGRCQPFPFDSYVRRERRGARVTFTQHKATGKQMDGAVARWIVDCVNILLGELKRSSHSYMRYYLARVPYCGYRGPVPTTPPSLWVSEGL